MFEPLNIFKSIKENYKVMFKDYKVCIWIFNFLIIPLLFATIFTIFLDSDNFFTIMRLSIAFFSIIVGFLINVLILIINTKKMPILEYQKLSNENRKKEDRKEKLRKHISYNILTEIFFGIIILLMILFLPYSWKINLFNFDFILSKFIILFLFGYFIVSLINILSKFGVYILERFN